MRTLKEICRSTAISIGIAMTIFCIVGIVFDVRAGGAFSMDGYGFTKMVLGCVVTGLGFGIPSVIYNSERIPRPVQILIHMGIGCVVYTVTSFLVGWIGDPQHPGVIALIVLLQIVCAFVIWIFFMLFYRREAGAINEKIRSMGS